MKLTCCGCPEKFFTSMSSVAFHYTILPLISWYREKQHREFTDMQCTTRIQHSKRGYFIPSSMTTISIYGGHFHANMSMSHILNIVLCSRKSALLSRSWEKERMHNKNIIEKMHGYRTIFLKM